MQGHEVTIGARDAASKSVAEFVASQTMDTAKCTRLYHAAHSARLVAAHPAVKVAGIAAAAAGAELVFLVTPWGAVEVHAFHTTPHRISCHVRTGGAWGGGRGTGRQGAGGRNQSHRRRLQLCGPGQPQRRRARAAARAKGTAVDVRLRHIGPGARGEGVQHGELGQHAAAGVSFRATPHLLMSAGSPATARPSR